MNPNDKDKLPLVRIGQGQYARDYFPRDFGDPPRGGEGGSVALVVLIVVFLLGILIGAWLW